MNGEEWMACADARLMLEALRNQASERKARLFACACARRVWLMLPDSRSREAIEAAERFADSFLTGAELLGHFEAAFRVAQRDPFAIVAANTANLNAWTAAVTVIRDTVDHWFSQLQKQSERAGHVRLLREIFGNPFHPIAFSSEWRTDTAMSLVRTMYEDCEFSAMPILADALQDAGCDNDDVLNHCRGADPHVRGCWVVDLLLGKV